MRLLRAFSFFTGSSVRWLRVGVLRLPNFPHAFADAALEGARYVRTAE